ncbi:hypothetical protein J1N35_021905 [Gossypium stocksii]|uniref:DUF4283 domain-containing protein n=1 Tax=Gossypium stocksii TaxID=47602 RepID=A0A9D3VHM6_9ROSI|nr:hypothetical protein J1N35_021905 [Gossypium stocksii]
MEGWPWLFRKNLILFDRLVKLMERSQIWLSSSPFWIKIGPCLPEFDKKDLLHAIGVAFGGVIRPEINGDFCRLRIQLDVQKPLRRGAEDSRGRLCLAWKMEITVSLRSFFKSHIDVMIKEDNVTEEWRFTGFYDSPYVSNKNVS